MDSEPPDPNAPVGGGARRATPPPPVEPGERGSEATSATPSTPSDQPKEHAIPARDAFDGDEAPVMSGGRARGRRRTRLVVAGLVVLLLVLTGSAGALLLYGRSEIERQEIQGITPLDRVPLVLPDGEEVEIMNVLLIGSDDRDTLSAEDRDGLNLEDRSLGRRPDTLMLAQLELNGNGAALLSFPRDLRVELCDGSIDKINASFLAGERMGINGESCLVQTITNLTDIEIHHYAEVDFYGFMRVIEVLGGVTMYLDQPMIDSKAHLNVPAGCVTLTPEQALGFVRSRGYDDDFGRIARQQRFIREVVEELAQVGVIANPAKLFSLVDAGANAVTTDQGFGLGVMRDVASGARNMSADRLESHTVPADDAMIDGISYVVEREDEAEALYASFRNGTVLRPQAAATEPEVVATEEPVVVPPITVLNATGQAGLAALGSDFLIAEGYEVASVGNADDQGLAVTEVVHGPGHEAAAAEVAGKIPGSAVRADESIEGIALVLGADVDTETLRSLAETAGVTDEPTEPTPTPQATEATPVPVETPERSFRGVTPVPDDVDC